MKLPHRRQFLHLAAGAAALPLAPHVARAQAYPTRPVRLVVGFLSVALIDNTKPSHGVPAALRKLLSGRNG